MEGSATNEVRQGNKKSKERKSACEKEREIPLDGEREIEIPPDLLREGNREMETLIDIEVRQQERKSEDEDKEEETPPDFVGERTTKLEANADVEVRESETKSEERENEGEREKEEETPPDTEMEKDAPPNDDICPIWFENYNICCKTNCGHWYCVNCIITFWLYKSLFLLCKCPLCNQPIKTMTPDPSLSLWTEIEVVEAMCIIWAYNRLSGGGVHSLILKMRLLSYLAPIYFKRFLPSLLPVFFVILIVMGVVMFLMLRRYSRGLLDPDKLIFNYAIARIIAIALTLSYNYYGFAFLPGGLRAVSTIFEGCTVGLVLILAAVGLFHRITNNRRLRRQRLPPVVEPLPPVPGP